MATSRPVAEVAVILGISAESIYTWRKQDRIDKGLLPGLNSHEKAELTAANKRIAELEAELAHPPPRQRAAGAGAAPKRKYEAIQVIAAEGLPIEVACRVLATSTAGYYAWLSRPPSAKAAHHALLTDVIAVVHATSKGTYGTRRVHAELTLGRGLIVGKAQVKMLMHRAGLKGVAGRPKWTRIKPDTIPKDLVKRDFARNGPNQLWVTDITEHPTREGKVYCAVVLDTYSRRVVGWSIDASPTAALVTNALGMAIDSRRPAPGTLIHSDQGVQFASWAFTDRAKASGLVPSMGSIGDCYDNSMIESFWSRMQVELLDRQLWTTRLQLANAIFEFLEIWHNRQRRHSRLGILCPIEFERSNKIIVV